MGETEGVGDVCACVRVQKFLNMRLQGVRDVDEKPADACCVCAAGRWSGPAPQGGAAGPVRPAKLPIKRPVICVMMGGLQLEPQRRHSSLVSPREALTRTASHPSFRPLSRKRAWQRRFGLDTYPLFTPGSPLWKPRAPSTKAMHEVLWSIPSDGLPFPLPPAVITANWND